MKGSEKWRSDLFDQFCLGVGLAAKDMPNPDPHPSYQAWSTFTNQLMELAQAQIDPLWWLGFIRGQGDKCLLPRRDLQQQSPLG